uniref:Chromosome 9 open reading frame 24 n=1 Tax=Athene cunicularia TaxID=194338 RepID=A0A663NB18_ATHCN
METFLHSIPVSYPLNPTCINQCGNYPHPVPVLQLKLCPCCAGMHPGRGPYWGYYSPCSACHHCLRGMDYYIDGASAIRGIPCCTYSPRAMFCASTHCLQSFSLYRSLRCMWGTRNFKKTGGVQRDSYTIYPEFTSEAYSAPCCW